MKSVIHIIVIFLSISIYGCESNNNEFEITDVQFKENICKPMYMNYDYGTPICNKQDLDEYRLKRLGQKVRVTYYDKSIRIEILDTDKSKEFILDSKGNGKYSGDGIDAVINETLSNNTIVININAQKELDVNLTIFQRYAESAKKQNVTGFGSEYSANEEYWLRTNKSITITARNQH